MAQVVTLSDNLASLATFPPESISATRWVTSSFATDAKTYHLDSVVLRMRAVTIPGTAIQVEIDTSVGSPVGQPGELVGILTPPATIPLVTSDVLFDGNGIALEPFTTYWIVVKAQASEPFEWEWTNDDVGVGAGFQQTWGVSENSGGTWTTYDSQPMIMQVTAVSTDTPWLDLGHALAGTNGEPRVGASGPLLPGTSASVSLGRARPDAVAYLVTSHRRLDAPFQGGVLVPAPMITTAFMTDSLGKLDFTCPAPIGLPPYSEFYLQFWIPDPVGPEGFAASNALRATVP